MSLADVLFGRPIATTDERGERIGSGAGIPIFGLDALSSAAYGPEAALTLLIPLGAAGIAYILPISLSIIILLSIVYFSYRQTIQAHPTGGGSYTVARENLGPATLVPAILRSRGTSVAMDASSSPFVGTHCPAVGGVCRIHPPSPVHGDTITNLLERFDCESRARNEWGVTIRYHEVFKTSAAGVL